MKRVFALAFAVLMVGAIVAPEATVRTPTTITANPKKLSKIDNNGISTCFLVYADSVNSDPYGTQSLIYPIWDLTDSTSTNYIANGVWIRPVTGDSIFVRVFLMRGNSIHPDTSAVIPLSSMPADNHKEFGISAYIYAIRLWTNSEVDTCSVVFW